jgi:hypothetical protein
METNYMKTEVETAVETSSRLLEQDTYQIVMETNHLKAGTNPNFKTSNGI